MEKYQRNNLEDCFTQARLEQMLREATIRPTDTYDMPPQIIWIDDSVISTLGNFSASVGKAKAKKTFNVSAYAAAYCRTMRC